MFSKHFLGGSNVTNFLQKKVKSYYLKLQNQTFSWSHMIFSPKNSKICFQLKFLISSWKSGLQLKTDFRR